MRNETISGFSSYWIWEDGTVYTKNTHRVSPLRIKPQPRNGYLRVKLKGDCGSWHWKPVHLLVLEAFKGPRPTPRHHGAHGDGILTNNHLDNLSWKLPEENEADKKAHGTAPRGGPRMPSHHNRVREIRRRVAAGESYTKIAARYGMHRHSVSRIARGLRRRKHAP